MSTIRIVVCCSIVFSACLFEKARAEEPSGVGKFATPQECFEAYSKVPDGHSTLDVLPYMTDYFEVHVAGDLAFAIEKESKKKTETGEACGKLREKHGLDKIDIASKFQQVRSRAAALEFFIEIGNRVENRRDFIAGVEEVFKPEPGKVRRTGVAGATVTDVKTDGELATATVKLKDGTERTEYFRRSDGSWRMCLLKDEPELRKVK